MPHAVGSIADYDLVLSISAEAINRQFKILYDTSIKKTQDLEPPPRTQIKDASPAAPTEYLINHRLEMHFDKKGKPNPHYGLSSFIKCPTVSFDNLASKVNDYRTAKISIEFMKEGNEDSKFTEPYVNEDLEVEVQTTIVNGWTMSWEVKLGRVDIKNIMEDLIDPAKSKDSSSMLHPEVTKAFTKLHVDSRNFLVSSIFCVFQAAQMANTFQLRNADGKVLEMGEAPGDFMLTVSRYFTGMKVKPGQMTPDNPFVLGYGISQALPDIKEINAEIDPSLTPRYLVPKSFQLTCTPGTVDQYATRYTNGTLNFCILTHRYAYPNSTQEEPGRNTNGETNPSAGVLEQTFFNTTRTSSHDGIMAFCKELIYDKYICGSLGKKFLMDPLLIAKGLYGDSVRVNTTFSIEKFEEQSQRPPKLLIQRKFNTDYINDEDEFFMKNRRGAEGSTWVELTMTSDLLDNPTSLSNLDAQRCTYIDILYGADILCKNQTQGKVGLIKMEESWSTQYWASLDMRYRARLVIQAGKGGVWSVKRDDNNQKYPSPEFDNGRLKVNREAANGRFGAFATGGKGDKPGNGGTGWWNLFGKEAEIYERMSQVQLGIASPIKSFEDNVSKSLGELKQTAIMPAGDAFLFTGIDCDEKGNLYSHVTYHQGSTGAKRN